MDVLREGTFLNTLGKRFSFHYFILLFFFTFQLAMVAGNGFAKENTLSPDSNGPKNIKEEKFSSGDQVVREGLSIEFALGPAIKQESTIPLIEGHEAKVRFTVSDASSGSPVAGLFPATWIDLQSPDNKTLSCKDKIGSFLQARLSFRPTHDLNSWYLLALNEKASISIIDPLVETGSSQMLLDLVLLESPGEAWILDNSRDRLFVTLPDTGKVAVVDIISWDVINNIFVGDRPVQIALQPDDKYIWVGIDGNIDEPGGQSGVVIIDSKSQKVVGRIATGNGHHEISFSSDSQHALITNEKDGTVSVVDIWKLRKIKDIKLGQSVNSITYSTTANAFYITDSMDGKIHVVDGKTHDQRASIEISKGSDQIEFAPDGRWGFITNPVDKKVIIFDASINRIAHSFEIGKGPYHIVFSDTNAFVQAMQSATLSVIERSFLDANGVIPVTEIPIGKLDDNAMPSAHSKAIAITPEKSSLVIANPSDTSIYYYMEGMNAPMGSFGNFLRRPKAVLPVDRGIKETSPGVYEANVKLKKPGTYDVAFMLDNPRVTHCFTTVVEEDPILNAKRKKAIRLTSLNSKKAIYIGEPFEVRVKLTSGEEDSPVSEVKDLMVLTMAMNNWQKRVYAKPTGRGEYVAKVTFPRPGVYFVFFSSKSLKASNQKLPRLVFHAKKKPLTKKSALKK